MNSFTARYTPGDDSSPMAPAIEMIESCIARKYKESGPITEANATMIANYTIASLVTCGSAITALELGVEIDRETIEGLIVKLSENLAAIARQVGLDEETYMAATIRMYGDTLNAGRARG